MLKEVSIEIIRKCPNHCLHCSSSSDEDCPEILDYDRFVRLIKDAHSLGADTVCLSGGEPFLHASISDMIEFVASLGMQTYVYTSGITYDEHNCKASISKAVLGAISPSVTKLIFNIEAATSKTYDEIMGTTDCFDKMKQSVRDALANNIIVEAHFVPMKVNTGELAAVVRLCNDLGISKLSFLRLVLHGRAKLNASRLALSAESLEKIKTQIGLLTGQQELAIRIGVPLTMDYSCHRCEAAKGKLNIKYDGNVFPCEVFKNIQMEQGLDSLKVANIYESTLYDIYRDSNYLSRIRELSNEYSPTDYHETCLGQYLLANGGLVDGK